MVINVQKETIMKKIYINPTMMVVKLKRRPQLLSASDPTPKLGGTYSGGTVLSRNLDRFDDFDDE